MCVRFTEGDKVVTYHSVLSFVAGVALASVVGLAIQAPPQIVTVEQEENMSFAAVSFFDCDELIRVTFLTSFGRAETIRINSPAHLLDAQLRLSDVPYERAYFVINDRPCGFVVDDEKL